jgi:hypothetical protein
MQGPQNATTDIASADASALLEMDFQLQACQRQLQFCSAADPKALQADDSLRQLDPMPLRSEANEQQGQPRKLRQSQHVLLDRVIDIVAGLRKYHVRRLCCIHMPCSIPCLRCCSRSAAALGTVPAADSFKLELWVLSE